MSDRLDLPARHRRTLGALIREHLPKLVEAPINNRSWRTIRLGDHVESCLGKMLDQKKNQGTPMPYLANKKRPLG